MTSGDKGEAPEPIKRTLPPSFPLILLNTNLSHMGEGFLPLKQVWQEMNMSVQLIYITYFPIENGEVISEI